MSDKKHIDRLFQEKLKDFEVAPDDSVWDNIHSTLHNEDKRKRRVIPLWWKLAGVAALLALLLTVGIKFSSDNSNTPNTIVDTEKQPSDKSNNSSQSNTNDLKDFESQMGKSSNVVDENGSTTEESSNVNGKDSNNGALGKNRSNRNTLNASEANQNRMVTNSTQDSNQKNGSEVSNNNLSEKNIDSDKENAVANVTKNDNNKLNLNSVDQKDVKTEIDKLIHDSKNNSNTAVTNASDKMEEILAEDKKDELKADKSIEDAIAEANNEEEKDEKEKKLNRWSISPNVAPVYFNSLGKGSSLDDQFVNNTKDGDVTMSYGVGGSYAINDRLKVRAGINKVDLGYSTNNVIAFRSIDATSHARASISNISGNENAVNMTYLSSESLNRNITPEIINTKTQGSISQRFGFIEIPMEAEYALINNKLGVNVIGGFSTFIVDKNEIYSVIDGSETRIGEANNINNMSYSANFGVGINYNISEKIKVNVEPTFKYQINTFNDSSGDFKPFFIGVYTGLSYKF